METLNQSILALALTLLLGPCVADLPSAADGVPAGRIVVVTSTLDEPDAAARSDGHRANSATVASPSAADEPDARQAGSGPMHSRVDDGFAHPGFATAARHG